MEAIELLHRICKARKEPATEMLETLILGGMALTDILDKEAIRMLEEKDKSRYVRLFRIFDLFRS